MRPVFDNLKIVMRDTVNISASSSAVSPLGLLAHPREHVVSVDVRCPGGKRVYQMAVPAGLHCVRLGRDGLHWLLNQHSTVPCVGASGAISGIAGTYLVLFAKSKFDLVIYFRWTELKTYHTRATTAVMAWFGEQFLLGLLTQALGAGGIAY
jgi:hypothetical protein